MQILNAAGEPYFGSSGLAVGANVDGDWVACKQYAVVSLSCELGLGATAITGNLYAEVTADPARIRGISRVVLPDGCLHTSVAGVTLPSPRTAVALAGVANGSAFTISFSAPVVGWMRWRWAWTSGGSAPNRLYGYLEGI